ncbi:MAG: transcription antitermination factor NusB [Bacilli bacterium]
MNRNESRVIIMTILYQVFMYKNGKINFNVDKVIKDNLEIENEFVKNVVNGVLDKQLEIDEVANKALKDWTIDRLGLTDQAILRMGIYELLYTDTPEIVAINEAIELSKKYSDDKVKNMINGVLDKVYHDK